MVPALIAGAGLFQTLLGAAARKKGMKGLEAAEQMYQKNPYQEDAGISDYYNRQKALASASGLDSVEGRLGQQQIERNLLTGLRQTRGQRGRDVSAMLRGSQDATSGLLGRLAQQRRASTAALGGAAQMKMGEAMKKYKYNVLDPASRKYNLEAQRSAEGGSMISQGLGNIISGIGSWDSDDNDGGSGSGNKTGKKKKP